MKVQHCCDCAALSEQVTHVTSHRFIVLCITRCSDCRRASIHSGQVSVSAVDGSRFNTTAHVRHRYCCLI